LVDILTQNHIEHEEGTVLTTDGVYRETKSKLAKIQRRGVLAINMETSALYAVAKHRGVEIASAQIISDQLTESGWYPAFSDQQVLDNMETLPRLVVTALSKA
jgi:purine-nucleoside phosphorylase